MISERDSELLVAVIRKYIADAEAVSSASISDVLPMHGSSATIRNRFAELTEEGYLEQPHTSSGRIPTEKAFRMYVNLLLSEFGNLAITPRALPVEVAYRLRDRIRERAHTLAGVIHANAQIDAVGFTDLFSEPEFSDQDMTISVGRLIEHLQEKQGEYVERSRSQRLLILIGKEIPEKHSERLSMVIAPVKGHGMLFVTGPTRLRYADIINELTHA